MSNKHIVRYLLISISQVSKKKKPLDAFYRVRLIKKIIPTKYKYKSFDLLTVKEKPTKNS